MWTCHALPPAEWPALAGFIRQHNLRADGRVRCLHAEHGSSVLDQADELRGLAADEACFVAAQEGSLLAGMIGAEFDATLRRAWVRGPLTASGLPQANAAALRRALIDALRNALPELQRFDAFVQIDESPLRESYADAGFRALLQHHVMSRDGTRTSAPPWPAAVHDARPEEAAELLRLHEETFPATYLPGDTLWTSLDADHRLFVAAHAGKPAGYVYVQHKPFDNEAYIDFVAVAEAARGHGLGRALLEAAVHWAFVERSLPRISLTVRQDRAPALGLYRSVGFVETAAGLHLSFERP